MRRRYGVIQWLMFQMASVGPMLGQAHHFRRYALEQIRYAVVRYMNETHRIYGVIDKRLSEMPYLAGECSIADMATYPWLRTHHWQRQNLEDFPHLKRWYDSIEMCPAVQRELAVMKDEFERARQAPPTRSRGRSCSARGNSSATEISASSGQLSCQVDDQSPGKISILSDYRTRRAS